MFSILDPDTLISDANDTLPCLYASRQGIPETCFFDFKKAYKSNESSISISQQVTDIGSIETHELTWFLIDLHGLPPISTKLKYYSIFVCF